MSVAAILEEVVRIAPSLHKAGTFSTRTLEALARHATVAPVHHSAETGSGASTLLFSHLSPDHTVFALDAGTGSVRSIETSPLLRRGAVTFVEGPTQVTLPRHTFVHRLQLALIDGPHGYPFPDLEYYYLYPQLDPGALLIVDDIHIPTITNLFDVVSADEMFDLQEVVETTAFFRRTTRAHVLPARGRVVDAAVQQEGLRKRGGRGADRCTSSAGRRFDAVLSGPARIRHRSPSRRASGGAPRPGPGRGGLGARCPTEHALRPPSIWSLTASHTEARSGFPAPMWPPRMTIRRIFAAVSMRSYPHA